MSTTMIFKKILFYL